MVVKRAAKAGVLNGQEIKALIQAGYLQANPANVGPASLDLTLSDEGYLLGGFFLPGGQKNPRQIFHWRGLIKKPINWEKPLLPGEVYLFRLRETLHLPPHLRALASPKSSIGRLDIHVRLLNTQQGRFDSFAFGYQGQLWAFLTSRSFPVRLQPGLAITQLRFLAGDPRLRTYRQLQKLLQKHHFIFCQQKPQSITDLRFTDYDNQLVLTLNLDQDLVAWQARSPTPILDLAQAQTKPLPYSSYFMPIYRDNLDHSLLFVRANGFYLLGTRQALRLPADWAVEFSTVDTYSGEFRSHYAGFIDPGWGEGMPFGRPLTLELRPFENVFLTHNQPIVKASWDRLLAPTPTTYDRRATSHYRQALAPSLSRYFASLAKS